MSNLEQLDTTAFYWINQHHSTMSDWVLWVASQGWSWRSVSPPCVASHDGGGSCCWALLFASSYPTVSPWSVSKMFFAVYVPAKLLTMCACSAPPVAACMALFPPMPPMSLPWPHSLASVFAARLHTLGFSPCSYSCGQWWFAIPAPISASTTLAM